MTFWWCAGVAIVAFWWGSRWGHARYRVERTLQDLRHADPGLTTELPIVYVERRVSRWPDDWFNND